MQTSAVKNSITSEISPDLPRSNLFAAPPTTIFAAAQARRNRAVWNRLSARIQHELLSARNALAHIMRGRAERRGVERKIGFIRFREHHGAYWLRTGGIKQHTPPPPRVSRRAKNTFSARAPACIIKWICQFEPADWWPRGSIKLHLVGHVPAGSMRHRLLWSRAGPPDRESAPNTSSRNRTNTTNQPIWLLTDEMMRAPFSLSHPERRRRRHRAENEISSRRCCKLRRSSSSRVQTG